MRDVDEKADVDAGILVCVGHCAVRWKMFDGRSIGAFKGRKTGRKLERFIVEVGGDAIAVLQCLMRGGC